MTKHRSLKINTPYNVEYIGVKYTLMLTSGRANWLLHVLKRDGNRTEEYKVFVNKAKVIKHGLCGHLNYLKHYDLSKAIKQLHRGYTNAK